VEGLGYSALYRLGNGGSNDRMVESDVRA
jgi:hypothetical protein